MNLQSLISWWNSLGNKPPVSPVVESEGDRLRRMEASGVKIPVQIPPKETQVLGEQTEQARQAMPTPTPQPQGYLDFPKYVSGEGVSDLTQPPSKMAQQFFDVYGPRNEATQAAAVSAAEHLNQPWATDLIGGPNPNGTYDYGLMQNNEATFRDLLKRRYGQMQAIKPNISINDLLEAIISMKVGELSRQDEEWSGTKPFSQWYGWQDKGWQLK